MGYYALTEKNAVFYPSLMQAPSVPSAMPVMDPKRSRLRMVRELGMRGITDGGVLEAMGVVPRHLFVPEALRARAYEDAALPIGHGQTISRPFTVAMMTQLLEARPGMRVLEVGTGSGYQAAVLACMGCQVCTVETVRELYLRTRELLRRLNLPPIHMVRGDGAAGLPDAAPFDRIIVTAGGPGIPRPLTGQIDEGGFLLIPVGQPGAQRMLRMRRRCGKLLTEDFGPAKFVDLVGDHGRFGGSSR